MEQKSTETQDEGQKVTFDNEMIALWLVRELASRNIEPIFALKTGVLLQMERGVSLDWVTRQEHGRLLLDLSESRIFFEVGDRQHEDLVPGEVYQVMSCTFYPDATYKRGRVKIHRVGHLWGTKILEITDADLLYWMHQVGDPAKQQTAKQLFEGIEFGPEHF